LFEAIGELIRVRRCAPGSGCWARGSVRRIVARALIRGEPVVLGRVGASVFQSASGAARQDRIRGGVRGDSLRLGLLRREPTTASSVSAKSIPCRPGDLRRPDPGSGGRSQGKSTSAVGHFERFKSPECPPQSGHSAALERRAEWATKAFPITASDKTVTRLLQESDAACCNEIQDGNEQPNHSTSRPATNQIVG
jgi:hypothetical protein